MDQQSRNVLSVPPQDHAATVERELRSREYPDRVLSSHRVAAQNAAEYFGWTKLAIGALGLFRPTVTDNADGLINIYPGKLLGITAINWAHALLHAGWGVYGLTARGSHEQSVRYMQATAGVFGVLMAMGYNKVRGRDGTYMVMGMAIDQIGNYIHTAWTGIGLAYSLDPHLGEAGRALPAEA
jgi:hypothetical protein